MVTGLKKKMADLLMREAIKHHVSKTYFKKGVTPTAEQVMQNIDKKALNILLSQGYTEDEIRGMVENTIKEQKCKG